MFKKVLKWIGIILSGLLGLLVLAAVVLYLIGTAKTGQEIRHPRRNSHHFHRCPGG